MFWLSVIDKLENRGVDSSAIFRMFAFIDSFEPPIELPVVLNSFRRTIPHIQKLIDYYPTCSASTDCEQWYKICSAILSSRDFDDLLLRTVRDGKMPLIGYYSISPVYVALWQRPESDDCKDSYFKLLAHLLIIVRILRDRIECKLGHDIEEYRKGIPGAIGRALLDARNLTIDYNLPLLKSLPDDLCIPPDELLAFLDPLPHCEHIVTLIREMLKLGRRPHQRKQLVQPDNDIHSYKNNPAEFIRVSTNIDPEQNSAFQATVLQTPFVNSERAKEIEKVGCTPNEDLSQTEIVTSSIGGEQHTKPRSTHQKLKNKRKAKAQLAMLNQRLTSRWEVLSQYEVSSCLSAIADIIEHREQSAYLPRDAHSLEIAAFLTTLFWLGQRIEDVVEFRLYTHKPGPRDNKPGFVAISGSPGYWWIKPATPLRIRLPDEKQLRQAHKTASCLSLNSSVGVEQIISEYVVKEHRNHSRYLFSKKIEIYQLMIGRFVSVVNSRHATRLTLNRISDCMFNAIEQHPDADLTAAMYIVGREHFLGRNPSYYTAITASKLQSIYQNVCKTIRDRHFIEKPRERQVKINSEFNPQLNNCSEYIGSPFCPTSATVRALVAALKGSLTKAASSPAGIMKLLRLHNSMTRYTAFMIAFGTGFRAIRDPFLSAAEIDWKTGFAVLSDKDNEDGYNSRLIWIPPDCLQQLLLFKEHQKNLLSVFPYLYQISSLG